MGSGQKGQEYWCRIRTMNVFKTAQPSHTPSTTVATYNASKKKKKKRLNEELCYNLNARFITKNALNALKYILMNFDT